MIEPTRVYQAGDGRWIVLAIDGTKTYFNDENEAIDMANKQDFAKKAQQISGDLANLISDAKDLTNIYFDRTYDSGGGDEIIDADLSGLGITAANLASFITLAQQLANFEENSAVTTGDYGNTLNIMRVDV